MKLCGLWLWTWAIKPLADCVLGCDGEVVVEGSVPTTKKAMTQKFSAMPDTSRGWLTNKNWVITTPMETGIAPRARAIRLLDKIRHENVGEYGPFRDFASSDLVAMAASGMLSLTGDPSREPLNPPACQGYQVTWALGHLATLKEPEDYWLDFTDGVLTLHFTLPLKSPVRAQALNLEVYDPTWFVDFAFADKDPVALVGAPAGCKLSVLNAGDAAAAATKGQQQLGESFFNSLGTGSNYGAQFANKVAVQCP